jgi:hypothetical protein
MCAILATFSREGAVVLPALILGIEYAFGKSFKKLVSWPPVFRLLPFCFLAAIPLSRLVLNTPLIHRQQTFYATEYSLPLLIKNFYLAIMHSFNTVSEMCVLAVLIVITLFYKGQRKFVLAACGLFLAGIATQLFLKRGLGERDICFAVIGVALLISIGLKAVQIRLPAFKPYIVMLLLTLFFTTFATVRMSSEPSQSYLGLEQISRTSISSLKKKFPELPDKSFVYIQNSDNAFAWTLAQGKALRIFYNDTITVFFEGVKKKENLPRQCSGIYVFNYTNNDLLFSRFIDGELINEFLTEYRATLPPQK